MTAHEQSINAIFIVIGLVGTMAMALFGSYLLWRTGNEMIDQMEADAKAREKPVK